MEDQPMRRMKTYVQGGGSLHTPRWRYAGKYMLVEYVVEMNVEYIVEYVVEINVKYVVELLKLY